MNYKMVFYTVGRMLRIVGLLMLLPLCVAIIYGDNIYWAFIIPIAALMVLSCIANGLKPENTSIFAREGLLATALCWVLMSVFGALPYIISGAIPSFADAIFETTSGFSTTGATILTDVEALPNSLLFWRSLTQWIGGMGVLVFMLAVLPQASNSDIYLMKAEVPGPNVSSGKIVSKLRFTARILYGVYILLTVLEIVLLALGDMPLFDSITHSFATAATGGFGITNSGIAGYNSAYIEIVLTVFMLIFAVNFNIYYLVLIGKIAGAFNNEEFKTFAAIVVGSILIIMLNIRDMYQSYLEALRYSAFQVASIISTTGFATADFNNWPVLSKFILIMLMFVGGCAGSTGGGLKVSRIIMLFKSAWHEIRRTLNPRLVTSVKLDGKPVDEKAVRGVMSYLGIFVLVMACSMLLVALNELDMVVTSTAVITCINNVGPGLNEIGPMGNFALFSDFSKIVLSFDMIAGRLELLPILVLLAPSTWRRY